MTAATDRQHAPWWLHASAHLQWQQTEDPAALAGMMRALLDREGPAPAALAVARTAMAELEACFGGSRAARDERLRALWRRHDPATIAATQRVGVPNKLWERLLDRLDTGRASGRRCWLGTSEREGLLHQGIAIGRTTEWWGLSTAPGATYDDRLWAWGTVQEQTNADDDDLSTLSARLVWRSDGARWRLHPRLDRILLEGAQAGMQSTPLPRLADGPGYLLACIVDALAEVLGEAPYTSRDLAVLWATMLLPLLAPSIELRGSARPGTGPGTKSGAGAGVLSAVPGALLGGAPDYLQTLPFFMLHPRIQSTIVVLDRVCGLLLVEDHASLHQVLAHMGRVDDGAPVGDAAAIRAAIFRLITDMAEQALHRRAASRWDSGFGFKLFRKLLRDALSGGPGGFARQWDAVVHGEASHASGHDVGALAQRLREALSTALWFPGRPPYPDGPAVQQILDLTWLRWTDEDFLAT